MNKIFPDPYIFDQLPNLDSDVIFNWTSLFHYLKLQDIFENFPRFDADNPLFQGYVETLAKPIDKKGLCDLYDHLFKECLVHVKALDAIDPAALIERIQNAKKTAPAPIRKVLEQFESSFLFDLQSTMHSLILYLAWDRFCICLARLFDQQSDNPVFQNNLLVFRECLIESYDHIKQLGRTVPSFYRLMEALFFFEMREEKLQQHAKEHWEILNQSFSIFSKPEILVDPIHMNVSTVPDEEQVLFLTGSPQKQTDLERALTAYFLGVIQKELQKSSYFISNVKTLSPNDL